MMPDDPFRGEALDRALASLPRAQSPSPAFTDGVLRELNSRGLVRRPHMGRSWLAAAAAIFAAGIVTGAGSSLLIARAATSRLTAPRAAASDHPSIVTAWYPGDPPTRRP